MTIFTLIHQFETIIPTTDIRKYITINLSGLGISTKKISILGGYSYNTIILDIRNASKEIAELKIKNELNKKSNKEDIQKVCGYKLLELLSLYLKYKETKNIAVIKKELYLLAVLLKYFCIEDLVEIYKIRMDFLDELSSLECENASGIENLFMAIYNKPICKVSKLNINNEDIKILLENELILLTKQNNKLAFSSLASLHTHLLKSTKNAFYKMRQPLSDPEGLLRRVDYALSILTKRQSYILKLKLFENKTFVEIANHFTCSISIARSVYYSALKHLQSASCKHIFFPLTRTIGSVKIDNLVTESERYLGLVQEGPLYEFEFEKVKESRESLDLEFAFENQILDKIDFTIRLKNNLRVGGFILVKDLKGKSRKELLAIRNFGRKSLKELRNYLIQKGLKEGYPFMD